MIQQVVVPRGHDHEENEGLGGATMVMPLLRLSFVIMVLAWKYKMHAVSHKWVGSAFASTCLMSVNQKSNATIELQPEYKYNVK